jgi:hypothetical protein
VGIDILQQKNRNGDAEQSTGDENQATLPLHALA